MVLLRLAFLPISNQRWIIWIMGFLACYAFKDIHTTIMLGRVFFRQTVSVALAKFAYVRDYSVLQRVASSCNSRQKRNSGSDDVRFSLNADQENGEQYLKAMAELRGADSLGRLYSDPMEMWREEAGEGNEMDDARNLKRDQWYQKGVGYWQNVEASVDGVLGGYGSLNTRDVAESKIFIGEVFGQQIKEASLAKQPLVAVDCGAGVGRVTENFLLNVFDEVDLVEPVEHFLAAAKASLSGKSSSKGGHRAVNFFCLPLQEFIPAPGRYDVIWVQWCIGHLTDTDFINFFKRAQLGLKPGGIFVIKENNCKAGFVLDKEDSSVTRSDEYFRKLFKATGLHLYRVKLQRGFPKELFDVRMYALSVEAPPPATAISGNTRSNKKRNMPAVIH